MLSLKVVFLQLMQIPFIYLFVCQLISFTEIEVDSTTAIDTVVRSDKHRLALLEEETQLTKKLEDGDVSVGERLKEVAIFSLANFFSWLVLLIVVYLRYSLVWHFGSLFF